MYFEDRPTITCICLNCGESFKKGSEGDNEEYHLRCERELEHEDEDFESDYE